MYTAAKTCTSQKTPQTIWKNDTSKEKEIKLLKKIYKEGHHSIFEHCFFTFAISGISRTCSHQLVRHRIASYAQQSQRYVDMSKEPFVIPPSVKKNAKKRFEKILQEAKEVYQKLSKEIPKEDARFILPQAVQTNLVMTLNLREMMVISKERLCLRAQWEIRQLITKMKEEIKKIEPFLAELLQPKCIHLGYCPEEETCGLMPLKE